jgi:FkbM family methyltransferase
MPKLPSLDDLRAGLVDRLLLDEVTDERRARLIKRLLPHDLTNDRRADLVKVVLPDDQYQFYNPTRQVSYLGRPLVFNIASGNTVWRVDHFFDAEPETLDWLAQLKPNDVLYDVGANVGMYSIVAAKVHGARVFSFEPEALSYAVLNKNIAYNQCEDLITAYCLAISSGLKIDRFYLSCYAAGGAMHSFGEPKQAPQDGSAELKEFEPCFSQGAISFAVDDLIARGLPPPTFIKIDVDGFEDQVIAGASNLLATAEQLTVLVEADPNLPSHLKMLDYLGSLGYECVRRGANCIYRRG